MTALASGRRFAQTCREISGRYAAIQILSPNSEYSPFVAYCDHNYEGGGWNVIQNRFEGEVSFHRGWKEYEKGFGDLAGELWLGLRQLHLLTTVRPHELHVVMEDFDGKRVVAKYSNILVGGEDEKYALKELGSYSGDAGDLLRNSLNMKFSTFDADNDLSSDRNCAKELSGAWWFKTCNTSNINGLYSEGKTDSNASMMRWQTFKGPIYGLKKSRMMIRAAQKSFWDFF